jgi:hypothetical protein
MDMDKLSIKRRAQIIACLLEGNSVRATRRLTHSSKDAVLKLVVDAGANASHARIATRARPNLAHSRTGFQAELWG